jgi:3-isopropylmalate/(R)-2-methylmalate dehydratase small subunit
MQKFETLTATAAPLPIRNVDTDMIIPKQFLKTIKRTGLKEGLFYEMRYTVEGKRIDDFVLHNAPYDAAKILVSLDNFGCGSSREHAPWALLDYGIRCVIAPSFADIFYNNCFKNGVLPIALPEVAVAALLEFAGDPENSVTIDLPNQIVRAQNVEYRFEIDPFRKHCLLNGLDDIGLTLEKSVAIANYEQRQQRDFPWVAA